MTLNRFRLGAGVSIAWFVIMLGVAIVDWSTAKQMGPNEWGDFFAGFFAPLAFLWLVLGYLQQGDELQLSTKALQLQAEELRNSVEQQRALVEVTRQQLDGEREALQLERLARQEAAKPLFVITNRSASFSGGVCNFDITIANAGNTVTQVVGLLEGVDVSTVKLFDDPIFVRSGQGSARLSMPAPFPETLATLTVSYIDAYGQPGRCIYSVSKHDATPNSVLAFHPIEC